MPLTPQQKNQLVINKGLDPSQYTVSDDESQIVPISDISSSTNLNYLTPPPQQVSSVTDTSTTPSTTPFQAFRHNLEESAPSAIMSGAGAVGGAEAGAALGSLFGPADVATVPIGAIIGAIGGGLGLGKATKSLQDTLTTDDWKAQLAKEQQEHPIASELGGVAAIPLGGLNPNPMNTVKAVGTLGKVIGGGMRTASAEEIANLANVGGGAIIGGAQPIIEGDYNPTDIIKNVGIGALFNSPNKLGSFGGNDIVNPIKNITTDSLLAGDRIGATPTDDISPANISNGVQVKPDYASPDVTSTITGENINKGFVPTGSKGMVKSPVDAFKGNVNVPESQLNLMESEGGIVTPEEEEQTKTLLKAVNPEEVSPPVSSSAPRQEGSIELENTLPQQTLPSTPLPQTTLPTGTKFQEESAVTNPQTELESQVNKAIQDKGLPSVPSESWFNSFKDWLGKERNTTLEKGDIATSENTPAAGMAAMRKDLNSALIKVNPAKAGIDTIPHEVFHVFKHDLETNGTDKDKSLISKYNSAVENSPEYQNAKQANPNLDVDEFQASQGGLEFLNRQLNLNNESPIKTYFKDLVAGIKNKWTGNASEKDLRRLLNYRMTNDPSFNEYFKEGNVKPVINTNEDNTKFQEQSKLSKLNPFEGKENSLGYHTFKLTRPLMDEMILKGGAEGKTVAEGMQQYFPHKDEYYGKYQYPIDVAAKGLSTGELNKVRNVLIKENADKKFYNNLLSPKELGLYKAIKSSLLAKQNDLIAENRKISDYDANGKEVLRAPGIDPYYYPNRPSSKAIDTLLEGGQKADKLKDDFIQYQLQHGISPKAAQEKLNSFLAAYDSHQPNQTKFNANRLAEGVGLPNSWMKEESPLKDMSVYNNRVSADRAYHNFIESNPNIKAIIDKEDGLNPTIKQALDTVKGEAFDKSEATIKAANRVATSLMLGPLTNIHIAGSSIANALNYVAPKEVLPAFTHALTSINKSLDTALQDGYARKDYNRVADIIDINSSTLDRLRGLSNVISKFQGRDLTNNFTKGFLQGMGEWVVKARNVAASQGDKEALAFMQKLDPTYKPNEQYTKSDLDRYASTFANYIHGAHDIRTLPAWMLKDSWLQPFFSLASWSIAQTNQWLKHVWTPATKGNMTPLIMSTLGAGIGGYAIQQLREKVADKKTQIPSLNEIVNSSRGVEGNIPLVAYNLMQMSSFVGFAGILSQLAKTGLDIGYKNIPQGATFPLDEAFSGIIEPVVNGVSALANSPQSDYMNIGTRMAIDMAKNTSQSARIALSWLSDSPDLYKTGAQAKKINSAEGDIRRFNMVEGLPYDQQTENNQNPYLNVGIKNFKKESDITEAQKMLPQLIDNAIQKANGNIDVLKSELNKLKETSYQTLPNPQSRPQTFGRYINFLTNTQGKDVADERVKDYFTQNYLNSVKGSLVPSI